MLTPAAIAARIASVPECVIGAVAEILEHVLAGGERRLADPVGALATHMGRPFGMARRNELHHPVAADPGIAAAAFGDDGR